MTIPYSGLLRIQHIIGDANKGIPPLIPISRSTFYAKVKTGEFPKPIRASAGVSVWRAADIEALLDRMGERP